MTLLWVGIAVLLVVTLGFGLWPLLRRVPTRSALDQGIAHYAARRAEIRRQRASGEIGEAESIAAEAELARELLAIERREARIAGSGAGATRTRMAGALLVLMVPAISLAVYARIGNPAAPDRPLAARMADPRPLDIADALRRIEAHLQKNPNDARGYEVVAPVYLNAGRFADAAEAWRRLIELSGESPERLSSMGEALVAAADGVVVPAARAAFMRSLELRPDFDKSRFYLALAQEQEGDAAGAHARLLALAGSMPEGPQRLRVVAELERLAAEQKAAGEAPQGPAGRAVAALPPEEREAAIRAMVEGLAGRLAQAGGSGEEWLRLIRARLVLGERERAIVELAAARKALAGDERALAALTALASGLGLEPAGRAP